MTDEALMRRTLNLAAEAQSWTNPNPMVGALLVKNNRVIGEGFHKKYGEAHAEINAIAAAGNQAKGSTLYVNLEPCSRHGNTPPCADTIIKSGVKKVVYASSDPSQEKSSEILAKAGIEVISDVLKSEADFLNRKFLYFAENNLPYVTIKFASSLDGKLATKSYDSKWITNDKARKYARSLRAESQAILVGSNTVLKDNPHLGARQKNKKNPVRIVLDTNLKTSPDSQIYRDSNVIIFAGNKASKEKIEKFRNKSIAVRQLNSETIQVEEVLGSLAEEKIISVVVEGGGEVIGSFLDCTSVNEIYAFYAPVIIGGNAPAVSGAGASKVTEALRIKNPQIRKFDDNFLVYGLV